MITISPILKSCRSFAMGALASMVALSPAGARYQDSVVLKVYPARVCWVEAYTNSAAVWRMKLWDGDEVVAVFRGSGTDFAPMEVVRGSARIRVRGRLIAEFSSATGTARVKNRTRRIYNRKGNPAVIFHSMGGEDGVDDDWQDFLSNVTCLRHSR